MPLYEVSFNVNIFFEVCAANTEEARRRAEAFIRNVSDTHKRDGMVIGHLTPIECEPMDLRGD